MFQMQLVDANIVGNNYHLLRFLVRSNKDDNRIYPLLFNGKIIDEYSIVPIITKEKIENQFKKDFGNGDYPFSICAVKEQIARKSVYLF